MRTSKTLILAITVVAMVIVTSTAAARSYGRSYSRSYSSSSSSALTAAVVAGAVVAASDDSEARVAATCKMPEESDPKTLYKCLPISKQHLRLVDGELRYCPDAGFKNYHDPGEQCREYKDGILGFLGITQKAETLSLEQALEALMGSNAKLYSVIDAGRRYLITATLPLAQ